MVQIYSLQLILKYLLLFSLPSEHVGIYIVILKSAERLRNLNNNNNKWEWIGIRGKKVWISKSRKSETWKETRWKEKMYTHWRKDGENREAGLLTGYYEKMRKER